MSRTLVILGLLLVVAGLLWQFVPGASRLVSWFGRLPGDIRIENGGSTVFIPIVSCLLLSVLASLLLRLFR